VSGCIVILADLKEATPVRGGQASAQIASSRDKANILDTEIGHRFDDAQDRQNLCEVTSMAISALHSNKVSLRQKAG